MVDAQVATSVAAIFYTTFSIVRDLFTRNYQQPDEAFLRKILLQHELLQQSFLPQDVIVVGQNLASAEMAKPFHPFLVYVNGQSMVVHADMLGFSYDLQPLLLTMLNMWHWFLGWAYYAQDHPWLTTITVVAIVLCGLFSVFVIRGLVHMLTSRAQIEYPASLRDSLLAIFREELRDKLGATLKEQRELLDKVPETFRASLAAIIKDEVQQLVEIQRLLLVSDFQAFRDSVQAEFKALDVTQQEYLDHVKNSLQETILDELKAQGKARRETLDTTLGSLDTMVQDEVQSQLKVADDKRRLLTPAFKGSSPLSNLIDFNTPSPSGWRRGANLADEVQPAAEAQKSADPLALLPARRSTTAPKSPPTTASPFAASDVQNPALQSSGSPGFGTEIPDAPASAAASSADAALPLTTTDTHSPEAQSEKSPATQTSGSELLDVSDLAEPVEGPAALSQPIQERPESNQSAANELLSSLPPEFIPSANTTRGTYERIDPIPAALQPGHQPATHARTASEDRRDRMQAWRDAPYTVAVDDAEKRQEADRQFMNMLEAQRDGGASTEPQQKFRETYYRTVSNPETGQRHKVSKETFVHDSAVSQATPKPHEEIFKGSLAPGSPLQEPEDGWSVAKNRKKGKRGDQKPSPDREGSSKGSNKGSPGPQTASSPGPAGVTQTASRFSALADELNELSPENPETLTTRAIVEPSRSSGEEPSSTGVGATSEDATAVSTDNARPEPGVISQAPAASLPAETTAPHETQAPAPDSTTPSSDQEGQRRDAALLEQLDNEAEPPNDSPSLLMQGGWMTSIYSRSDVRRTRSASRQREAFPDPARGRAPRSNTLASASAPAVVQSMSQQDTSGSSASSGSQLAPTPPTAAPGPTMTTQNAAPASTQPSVQARAASQPGNAAASKLMESKHAPPQPPRTQFPRPSQTTAPAPQPDMRDSTSVSAQTPLPQPLATTQSAQVTQGGSLLGSRNDPRGSSASSRSFPPPHSPTPAGPASRPERTNAPPRGALSGSVYAAAQSNAAASTPPPGAPRGPRGYDSGRGGRGDQGRGGQGGGH